MPVHYHLSFSRALHQVTDIRIDLEIPASGIRLTLPQWRPGRYARQEFARHISDFRVMSTEGEPISWQKTGTNTWQITPRVACQAQVFYASFCNQQDAGGSYTDDQRILFNGVTCLMYVPEFTEHPCTMSMELPEGFICSEGLPEQDGRYRFDSIHHLLDSPFLASPMLEHHELALSPIKVHLWIAGNHSLHVSELLDQIRTFTQTQIDLFGDCPVEEYHYLYLFWAHPYRHGVEHQNSTVIVLGPGMAMHRQAAHKSLLEISSHEFFHTWNVKSIRPLDMLPYDYSKENYSRLHYVTEGVTTYYGDLMLWKSGIWTWDQWLDSINGELSRHYRMAGKDFTSLSDASFDSWVNGYDTSGFPNRRISFYTKGYLAALLTDHHIRQCSGGTYSLDDVMYDMYLEFGKTARGYTEESYRRILEHYAGQDMTSFFAKYIHGTQPLDLELEDIAVAGGMKLWRVPPQSHTLALTGIEWKQESGTIMIDKIWPDSPAERAPLYPGDTLLAVNNVRPGSQPDRLFESISPGDRLSFTVSHHGEVRQVEIQASLTTIAAIPQLMPLIETTPEQLAYRAAWKHTGGARRMTKVEPQQRQL